MNKNRMFSICFISLFLIFSFTQVSFGQGALPEIENPWELNIPPRLGIPFDISMLNKDTGFVAGYPAVYQTTDGGSTWSRYNPLWVNGGSQTYRRFYQESPTHWVIGGECLLRSTMDAGTTWHDYWSPQDPYNPDHIDIYDISMKDKDIGYACGGHAMVLKTSDGGITWQKQRQGKGVLDGIACNDISNPMAVGFNTTIDSWITYNSFFHNIVYIYLSHAESYGLWGGETSNTWTMSTADTDRWGSVFFINSSTGWVSSTIEGTNKRDVLKTQDGGTTWHRYPLDVSVITTQFTGVKLLFVDENNGFGAATYEDRFYKTTDGGVTWTRINIPSLSLTGMYFTDRNNGWITGYGPGPVGYVLKTDDGGDHWRSISHSGFFDNCYLRAIHFNSKGIGYIGAIEVYQTLDKGSTWNYVGASSRSINQIYSLAKDTVYVLGTSNMPQISIDSGQTWSDLSSCQMDYPGRMQFYGEQTGWICGYDNNTVTGIRDLVYKTIDGGLNWNLVFQSSTAISPTSLCFIDPMNGWMAGSHDSTVRVTHDGGINWSPQYAPTTTANNPDFRDINFLNANKGWLVDGYGDIFTTQDGGVNWFLWGKPITSAWKRICFQNTTTGWIIGENGNLLYTVDGGTHWFITSKNLTPSLKDITFTPDGVGWIVSTSGSDSLYTLSTDKIIPITGMQNKEWEVFDDYE